MPPPIVGLDLDNTIIDYSQVFAPVAEEIGLLPAGSGLLTKAAVKADLRERSGEQAWMRLQGQVYGRFIGRAKPYPGCAAFVREIRARGARPVIVSHKTRYGHFDPTKTDLWEAALGWLDEQGFLAPSELGIERDDVHFETTREAKIARIAETGCRVFVDDLPEVLNHPQFPAGVERLWFARALGQEGGAGAEKAEGLRAHFDWSELMDKVLCIL